MLAIISPPADKPFKRRLVQATSGVSGDVCLQTLTLLPLLPGKEPDSLIECIWFRLKTMHSVGQRSKFSINYLHFKQSLIYN